MLKKFVIFAVIAAFIVAGCGAQIDRNDDAQTGNNGNQNVQSGASEGEGEAVASVNGELITESEYAVALQQTKENLALDSPDVSTDELEMVENQVLDSLINQKLLEQKINELNITVSDEEVDTQIAEIKAYYGDDFDAALAEIGLTLEELRDDISLQLRVNQYIESQIDAMSVSKEEAKQFYDEAVVGMEGAPAFEEVREFIEQDLAREKIIEDIRNSSTIEYL